MDEIWTTELTHEQIRHHDNWPNSIQVKASENGDSPKHSWFTEDARRFIKSVKVYSVTKCFTVKKYNFHKQIKTEYKITQSLICSSSCPGHVHLWSLGFAFDHWIDPVDIVHHFGVNTRFSRAPAAFPPADDPIQEADITPRTGQRTSRVALRKHTSRYSYKHTRTDQSGATQTADSHTWNLIYELNK